MELESISAQARQFKRHTTQYKARLEVHPDHADQFRLCLPDSMSGLAVTDVSEGGLGLRSGVYLPTNIRLTLHVSFADASSAARDLVIRAVVRRCVMIDHRPTYQAGLQFVEASGIDEQTLIKSVKATAGAPGQAVAVGGGRDTQG